MEQVKRLVDLDIWTAPVVKNSRILARQRQHCSSLLVFGLLLEFSMDPATARLLIATALDLQEESPVLASAGVIVSIRSGVRPAWTPFE